MTESGEKQEPKVDYTKAPVVLAANHVSKHFKLPTEQATGLKQAFINWTKGIKGYRQQQVLKDISFEVHQGEFFGIVGRNGGGKSTLLKIISKSTIRIRAASASKESWCHSSNWVLGLILN